jgi:hypothetical protein
MKQGINRYQTNIPGANSFMESVIFTPGIGVIKGKIKNNGNESILSK